MKSIILSIVVLLITGPCYAQSTTNDNSTAAKFMSYYNADNADSLYTLLADEVKPQLSSAALTGVIKPLRANFGKLINSEYFDNSQGNVTYVAPFERPGPVLYISLNSSDRVTGFFVNADKREAPNSVTVTTASALIKGTLSVPETKKAVPVILLIAGSGPTDRNGNSAMLVGRSNYFLQISDAMKQKNIAVLRYDKRGVGQSTTTKATKDVTFEDMVNDAAALINMLKADKRFSKIIVAGHSEGSLIGMLAAQREKADAFISLSGPGFPADSLLKDQFKKLSSVNDYVRAAAIIDSVKAGNYTKQRTGGSLSALSSAVQPYLHSWMKYDPRQVISKLDIPVLVIQGTTDLQVGINDAQALKKAKPNIQLKLITGMNHILKESPAERQHNMDTYTRPNLPLHPELMPVLVKFINSLK